MLDYGFYNMDCIEGMKQFPDKYFDLAKNRIEKAKENIFEL